jgi:hypothetical protein
MPGDDDFLDLEHKVERHDGELDLLLGRIETLEKDLVFIVSLQPIRGQLIAGANLLGNSRADQNEAQRCAEIIERYGLLAE